MESPYWIREKFDAWMPRYEVLKGDFVVGQVKSWRDAEKVLWELNQLWYHGRG